MNKNFCELERRELKSPIDPMNGGSWGPWPWWVYYTGWYWGSGEEGYWIMLREMCLL